VAVGKNGNPKVPVQTIEGSASSCHLHGRNYWHDAQWGWR